MASKIKSIPILKDNVAQNFTTIIAFNTLKKQSINFSKQATIASEILKKAKI
ncbi:hypothetical protein [Flavobacterium faecale]|uniref:hypothetical protein n=1 Tax=Flavobacterium faecale TaxID=1355330 RepID=UPI003AAE91A2